MLVLVMCTDHKLVKAELFFKTVFRRDQKIGFKTDSPKIFRTSESLKKAIWLLVYISEFFPKIY